MTLLYSHEFSDIMFTIGEVQIPAHKAILVSKSEYFATMVKNEWKESTNNTVKIEHVNVEAFKSVLEYIYTGEMKASNEQVALEVFALSKQYLLNDLNMLIGNEIKSKISMVNVYSIMKMAHDMKIESICKFCYRFLSSNFNKVLEKDNGMIYEAWKFILDNRVPKKKGETALFYENCSHYNGPFSNSDQNSNNMEKQIFDSLLKWARTHYSDMKDDKVQYLFSKIQLNLIASKDLVGSIRRSNIYDLNVLFDAIEKKILNGELSECNRRIF